jgi:diacylglycerol kinase (ATP)
MSIEQNQGPQWGPFLFVVNPNSGTNNDTSFLSQFSLAGIEYSVEVSSSSSHMVELVKRAISSGIQAVIAVGGDGTVNGIGTELIDTDVALGVIPTGSGNGIARHLGIPMDKKAAIKALYQPKIRRIDSLKVNDTYALGFAGLGFDGLIAERFSHSQGRGFGNYIKLCLEALNEYASGNFNIDGKQQPAFSIIAANINQFGNDAFINPEAVDNDGLFELIKINHPPIASFPSLASRLFMRTFHESKFVTVDKRGAVEILNLDKAHLQIDGEPYGTPSVVRVESNPSSLNVMIPNNV